MAFNVIHDIVSDQDKVEKKCWKQIHNIPEDEDQADDIDDDS